MTLRDIGIALMKVVPACYRYRAHKQTDQYIVWAEDSQGGSSWAGGNMQEQSIQGTVDYFTRTVDDPNFEKIQEVLNGLDLSWRLSSIQYEDETRYIHYEWVWEAIV